MLPGNILMCSEELFSFCQLI